MARWAVHHREGSAALAAPPSVRFGGRSRTSFPPEPSLIGRSLTRLGRALDRATLRGMSLAFDAALVPAIEAGRIAASAEPYRTAALTRAPERFFACLAERRAAEPVDVTPRRCLPGGVVLARRFTSDYRPFHVSTDSIAADCPENAVVPVEHWVHDAGARATVVMLHGFTMGNPRIDGAVLMAAEWFRLGLDVALVTLPFHGARCPAGARYSGEPFGSWHVGRLNEAVRQSVHDVDRVSRWLAAETGAPVGILGLSLGGYVAALYAGLRHDLAFVMPIVAPVCLTALPRRLFALSRRARARGRPPITRRELRAAYRVHSPLTYPLQVPRERVLVIAGRGDRIVPPAHAHALSRHWGAPAMHWFSGGHVVPFRRAAIFAAVLQHLGRLGLLATDER